MAVVSALRPYAKGARVSVASKSINTTTPEVWQMFSAAGIARRDVVANLVWTFDRTNQLHLAWNVNVDVLASADWLNIRVDAATGKPWARTTGRCSEKT